VLVFIAMLYSLHMAINVEGNGCIMFEILVANLWVKILYPVFVY